MSAPDASVTSQICIKTDSDIAGIGVRTAIYVQNFLSFAPAIYALRDKRVSKVELDSLETQSTGILITALAILLSVAIQPSTGSPVTNFHTTIILNLSWMNNTNAFIYFILRIYHELEDSWEEVIKLRIASPLNFKDSRNFLSNILKKATLNLTGIFGSLHLSLMAAIGIWLWHDPTNFQDSPPCAMQASLFVVGRRISFKSRGLQVWSLMIYSLVLIPGLNFALPTLLFLAPFLAIYQFHTSHSGFTIYIGAVRVGLAMLFIVNTILLTDVEVSLAKNASPLLEHDGTQWSFGQTLALLVLMVPVRDICETFFQRRSIELGKQIVKLLSEPARMGDAVMQLFKQGAIVKDAKSALIKAVEQGGLDVVKELTGRVVNFKDIKGPNQQSLLHCAAQHGHEEILKFLTQHMDNVDLLDGASQTPLCQATAEGHLEIVKVLIKHGADVHLADERGCTSLHYAALQGNPDIVKHLIKHGADVNPQDHNGWTPVYCAVLEGHLEVVKYLIEHEADVNIPNNDNKTALSWATERGDREISKYLIKHGARR